MPIEVIAGRCPERFGKLGIADAIQRLADRLVEREVLDVRDPPLELAVRRIDPRVDDADGHRGRAGGQCPGGRGPDTGQVPEQAGLAQGWIADRWHAARNAVGDGRRPLAGLGGRQDAHGTVRDDGACVRRLADGCAPRAGR